MAARKKLTTCLITFSNDNGSAFLLEKPSIQKGRYKLGYASPGKTHEEMSLLEGVTTYRSASSLFRRMVKELQGGKIVIKSLPHLKSANV